MVKVDMIAFSNIITNHLINDIAISISLSLNAYSKHTKGNKSNNAYSHHDNHIKNPIFSVSLFITFTAYKIFGIGAPPTRR